MIRNIINRRVINLKNYYLLKNNKNKLSKDKLAFEYLLEKKDSEIFLLKYFGIFSAIGFTITYSKFIIERDKLNPRYDNNFFGFLTATNEGIICGILCGILTPFCLVGSVFYIPILIYDKVKNKEKSN